ncbi:MAG: mannitol dehydrogenase family protein [Bosea sp. (in: a-proteobacteria)]
MKRLSPELLANLPAAIARPSAKRAAGPRIVHLGLGAFARAHLAAYTQDANASTGESWRIIGVSLQRPDMRDALAPQKGLYTLVTRTPEGAQHRILDVVHEVLVAPESPAAVIAMMADPDTQIVSLTVTEKGYCHDPATGRLRLDHPDIVHDLAHRDAPKSSIGFLVAGLSARREKGLAPFTVLCCDNLPSNGAVVRGLVLEFAQRLDATLAEWIAREGAFPSSMVDRIVPATTASDITETEVALGLHDAAPVMAEPFSQWVIEYRFIAGRPAWERVGAQLVSHVEPFEFMKLRLLNGAHSTLAYLGYLAGHETVAEASADPALADMLKRLWAEITPTVPQPPGVDLNAYTVALLARFQNPAIRHRTWQIAMDGSQKLPQRLLGTISDRLAAGQSIDTLSLGVAAWMRYVMGFDQKGQPIDVRDPLASECAAIAARASRGQGKGHDTAAIVDGLLGMKSIFGEELAQASPLRRKLVAHLDSLIRRDVHFAITEARQR